MAERFKVQHQGSIRFSSLPLLVRLFFRFASYPSRSLLCAAGTITCLWSILNHSQALQYGVNARSYQWRPLEITAVYCFSCMFPSCLWIPCRKLMAQLVDAGGTWRSTSVRACGNLGKLPISLMILMARLLDRTEVYGIEDEEEDFAGHMSLTWQ